MATYSAAGTPPYAVRTIREHYSYLTVDAVTARLRDYTFVNPEKKYLYFAVPKAACTAIKHLLRDAELAPPIEFFCRGYKESRRDMFVHARENVPLPSLVDLDETAQREALQSPEYLRMTVVRNPYTRLLSAWRNKIALCEPGYETVYLDIRGCPPTLSNKKLIGFDEFIAFIENQDLRRADPHWSLQVEHTFMAAIKYNLVGRTENLTEFLDLFAQHNGRRNQSSPVPGNPSEAFGCYSSDLATRVARLYAADFEGLGYKPDDWPPPRSSFAATVHLERHHDELIERNLILAHLYREVERLSSEMRKINKFHLLTLANALLTLKEIPRTLLRRSKRPAS